MQIGILALQGAFIEHEARLAELGVESREVRLPSDLRGLDGLIMPGGESTTIGQLAVDYGLIEPIRAFATSGRPVWGVCAGMIFLARQIGAAATTIQQASLGLMDIEVERNAFGRQVESFEADLIVPALDDQPSPAPFRAIFIRAPLIRSIGPDVQVIADLPGRSIVAARQANLLATAFHPELTGDPRFHRYFIRMASSNNV